MDIIQAFFKDAVFDKGYMWVFDELIQAVCKIDILDFHMEILSFYRGADPFRVQKVFFMRDKLYLVSPTSAKILIYEKARQKAESDFCLIKPLTDNIPVKYEIFEYGNALYFFSEHSYERIICFDTFSRQYSEKDIMSSATENINHCLLSGLSSHKGMVWGVLYGTPGYFCCDLSSETLDLFQSGKQNASLSGVCFDSEKVWLAETDSTDITIEDIRTITIRGSQSYSRIHDLNKFIAVCPRYGNTFLLIDKKTFSVKKILLPFSEREKQRHTGGSNIVHCREYADFIFLFPHNIEALFVINKRTMEAKRVQIQCENYIKKYFTESSLFPHENPDINLAHLFSFCEADTASAHQKETGRTGMFIWDTVRRNHLKKADFDHE